MVIRKSMYNLKIMISKRKFLNKLVNKPKKRICSNSTIDNLNRTMFRGSKRKISYSRTVSLNLAILSFRMGIWSCKMYHQLGKKNRGNRFMS